MLDKTNKSDLFKKLKPLSDVRVIGLIMFGVVVVLVTSSSIRILQVNFELQKKEALLRQKTDIQRLQNENLKLKNTYFETDEYLELTARRQFNKAAPGETLYLIPQEVAMSKTIDIPKPEIGELATESQSTKSKYRQNLDDWINFLFRKN